MSTKYLVILFCLLSTSSAQNLSDQDLIDYKTSRNFTGKVVLITESSTAVGRVICALFARLGAQVVVTGKDSVEVRQTAKSVQELSPFGLKVCANRS